MGTILIVDDEAPVRSALRRTLARVGFEIIEAPSGEAGMQVVGSRQLDCAITDLRMPGMGGHGFVRSCEQVAPTLPIIVLTGNGEMDDTIECLRHGVRDFLQKPWSESELRLAVERVTSPSRALVRAATPAPAAVLVREPTPAPAAAPRSPAPMLAAILERLRRGEVPYPSAPTIALEVRELAGRESSSIERIKSLVERDGYLAARIIRVANSGVFTGYGRATELKAAIARIGLREVRHLIDALVAHRFYEVNKPAWAAALQNMWRHSWARAVAMRMVAETLGRPPADAEAGYLVGLFADIGAPFLVKVVADVSPGGPDAESLAFIAANHAEIGASLARAWMLPPDCQRACQSHHAAAPFATLEPEVQLLHLGEAICVKAGIDGEAGALVLDAEAIERGGLTAPVVAALAAELQRYISENGTAIAREE